MAELATLLSARSETGCPGVGPGVGVGVGVGVAPGCGVTQLGWPGRQGTWPAGNWKPSVSWPSLMAGGVEAMTAFTYMGLSTTISLALSGAPLASTEVARRPKSTSAGGVMPSAWASDPSELRS